MLVIGDVALDIALVAAMVTALLFAVGFFVVLFTAQKRKHLLETSQLSLAKAEADLEIAQTQIDQAKTRENELVRDAGLAEARRKDQLAHHEQLNREIVKSQEKLQKDFEALSARVFEESRKKFESESQRTLNTTLDPIKKEMEQFRKRVDETHKEELAGRSRLEGQIRELQNQTLKIGEDAVQLAAALKGESKSQGNWGEMVLERLLEESGLEKGREYESQASFRNDQGKLQQPDVIIHLPESKDIVIDAKVSLVAYERFYNSESEQEKSTALTEHLQSLRAHFKSLSGKSYENIENINTLDFVFMFVPIEPAYLLALQEDPDLFQQAYDKGVVLVSPTTLMVTLKTVASIWRYEKQNRNAQEIADSAGALHDQFVLLVESLDELGKKIDSTHKSYEETRKRLADGRGNVIRRVDILRRLGAKSKKQLPESAKKLLDENS